MGEEEEEKEGEEEGYNGAGKGINRVESMWIRYERMRIIS